MVDGLPVENTDLDAIAQREPRFWRPSHVNTPPTLGVLLSEGERDALARELEFVRAENESLVLAGEILSERLESVRTALAEYRGVLGDAYDVLWTDYSVRESERVCKRIRGLLAREAKT